MVKVFNNRKQIDFTQNRKAMAQKTEVRGVPVEGTVVTPPVENPYHNIQNPEVADPNLAAPEITPAVDLKDDQGPLIPTGEEEAPASEEPAQEESEQNEQ